VLRQAVAFDPAAEPPRDEWFLRGTEVAVIHGIGGAATPATVTPTIRYPAPDTVIALDPDIPAGRERVVFAAAPAVSGLRWRIDDAVLPAERGRADWRPVPGRHVLVLEDATGAALSSVAFEVRGNRAP
jgi:penicillin-binding protein 1C